MGILSVFNSKYSHLKRYNQVIKVLLKYGFEDLVSYMNEKKRFSFIKKIVPSSTYNQSLNLTKWEKIRLVCEELGPTFIKFGQILSNRSELLPPELIRELEKLQDRVPPLAAGTAVTVIETELKKTLKDIFVSFEEAPFAAASMAQVHRGVLLSGEHVVMKIQRPGIKETIQSDIKVMYYLAEVFSRRIPSLKSFDPVGLVKNFEESITRELDFIHESINIQRFHNNFESDTKDESYVHSPKIYPLYTTTRLLTMEYVEGIKISDIPKLKENGYDTELLAKRLANSYFKQVFNYGFFHADPHPGNLLVIPGNKICYLDYGMMGNILRRDLEALGSLFLAINSKDSRRIIRSIQQLSDVNVIKNYRELENDVTEFMQNHAYRNINQNEISTVLLELKDIIIKHGFKVPTHFFLLVRSMVAIEGNIKMLDPNMDLSKVVKPFLIKLAAKNYNPVQFLKRMFNSVYEMGMYMEDFPRDLKNAIRRINSGEIKVDLRHKGIDPLVHTLNRVTKQLVSAMIIAALVIGSSQMIIHNIHPLWGRYSSWGVIGIIIAGLLSLGMLRDIRRGDHDSWNGWRDE